MAAQFDVDPDETESKCGRSGAAEDHHVCHAGYVHGHDVISPIRVGSLHSCKYCLRNHSTVLYV